jgi:ParB family chromosome partitioning protein
MLKSIPAFVRIANDKESLEMALVENIQRENLDPIEIALCYKRLIDEVMLTQEKMSERVGKKRSTISNYLRLLKLDPIVQTGIRDGFISMGHGRSLVTIENKEDQLNIYEKILEKSLSVRETEILANKSKKSEKKLKIKLFKEPFNTSLKKLKNKYNSEVKITLNGKEKGSIIIPFNNIDEFKELNKKLNGNK